MTDEQWNSMPLMIRLSNIAGEVKRCVDTRNNFMNGTAKKDYSQFYFDKVSNLISLTFKNDEKNRKREFEDELGELQRFLNGDADSSYIMRYWNQFTLASDKI